MTVKWTRLKPKNCEKRFQDRARMTVNDKESESIIELEEIS